MGDAYVPAARDGAEVSGLVHGAEPRAGGWWGYPHHRGRGSSADRRPVAPAILGAGEGSLRSHAKHTFTHRHIRRSGRLERAGRIARVGRLRHARPLRPRRGPERGAPPKTTVALWLALIVACVVLGSSAGMRTLSNSGSGPVNRPVPTLASPPRASRARDGERARPFEQPAAHRARGRGARGRCAPLAGGEVGRRPDRSPELSRAGGRTALVVVTLRGDPDGPDAAPPQVQHFVNGLAARQPGVTFKEAGSGSEDNAITQLVNDGCTAPS